MGVSGERRKARKRRHARVRRKLSGTDARPRLCVFRSNRYLYVQVISDESGRTLAAVSTQKEKGPSLTVGTAQVLGRQIAEKCKSLSIESLLFDRNGYKFHGRVKAIAESVREAGIRC
ncbi:MAG: 50S ribosomal protein L18 [Candidatus Binatia bacterium]